MSNNYPLPVFHFQVEWGGSRIGFTEVSGLTVETQSIDYREGSSREYHVTKMPGLQQYSAISMKRGITKGDNELFQWFNTVSLNKIERRDLTISLLNESHEPVVVWKVRNAWPSKVDGPTLNATGNEVAIETVELAHEGLSIEFT
ncbi:phage tail protein [Pedobacter sandarakinus]|uniref:phage tail protein n=1 Tax=Pedobacter sandarakinus TaxID=353156 RepID=UPI002246FFBF|nr:phage tail protein [Pedobacter sandarakinus]MCX2574544.1 phage tail protein [Pedobacter sandarakinus]